MSATGAGGPSQPPRPPLPLAGRRILVTRPAGLAEGLAALVRSAGGEAVVAPALEILDLDDPAPFHAVADRLEQFDLAIFVSRNAVRKGFALLAARRAAAWPARTRVAAVGQGTRAELLQRGFAEVIAPESQFDSEALLALPPLRQVAGLRVAIFRGAGGRRQLGDTLAARGALVEHAECYRRARPAEGARLLAAAWETGIDAVTVSSGEALESLFALAGGGLAERLAATPLLVPHRRVAAAAARRGARKVIVGGPRDAQTVAALVAYFGGAG